MSHVPTQSQVSRMRLVLRNSYCSLFKHSPLRQMFSSLPTTLACLALLSPPPSIELSIPYKTIKVDQPRFGQYFLKTSATPQGRRALRQAGPKPLLRIPSNRTSDLEQSYLAALQLIVAEGGSLSSLKSSSAFPLNANSSHYVDTR